MCWEIWIVGWPQIDGGHGGADIMFGVTSVASLRIALSHPATRERKGPSYLFLFSFFGL